MNDKFIHGFCGCFFFFFFFFFFLALTAVFLFSEAMDVVGLSREEQQRIFGVLAAVLNLGNIRFVGEEKAASMNLQAQTKTQKHADAHHTHQLKSICTITQHSTEWK